MDILDAFVTSRKLSPRQCKQRIRVADFRTMSEQDAVVLIARLLLHEREIDYSVLHEFPTDTAYGKRLMRLVDKNSKRMHRALINWLFVGNGRNSASHLYPFYLYNINYGKTRKIFNLLLKHEDFPPPYLYRILPNILKFYHGDKLKPLLDDTTNLDLWAPALNELLSKTGPVRHWLEAIDKPIYYYGGQTNTVLGMYDRYFSMETGAHLLNREADAYYDLGGGYNTPEINRLTGLKFTSLDLLNPQSHTENLMLVRNERDSEIMVSGEERQQYMARLAEIPYLPFNVFEDAFPTEHNAYVIVSTGFLTSTVRSKSAGHRGHGFYLTSLTGIQSIMRLVQMGKAVDLFTVNRATVRNYTFKTMLLSFRNGKLANLISTPDKSDRFTEERKQSILRLIHPDTSPYRYEQRTDDRWAIDTKTAAMPAPPPR